MIARIRKGNDFKHIWPITWNGQPEDFSDATDITLTARVYGQVKTLTEGVDYHIDGGTVMVDFTPTICDIPGTYTVELNYIKPSAEFIDGDRRSAVDVQAFQIVNTSADANATEGVSLPSEAMAAYALKYDDLTEAQKDELRGKGITSIDLTGEVGDTKTYTITYADGATFDFSVTDGHTPIFTFVETVLHIDGVPQVDLKGETGNGIASVELTSTVGLVKTYTITFTDSTTTTFTVTDGAAAVVQTTGDSIVDVMSQKAVTDEIAQLAGDVSQKASHGYVSNPKTLKEVEDTLNDNFKEFNSGLFIQGGFIHRVYGTVSSSASYQYSNFIPIGTKDIQITGYDGNGVGAQALVAFYDKDKVFIGYHVSGSVGIKTDYILENANILENTAYIRVSAHATQDAKVIVSANEIIKGAEVLNERINTLNDELGFKVYPIGSNLLSELTGSSVADTDIWLKGFLTENGVILPSDVLYHTKNYYRVVGGNFRLRNAFYGNMRVLFYDKNYNIIQTAEPLAATIGEQDITILETAYYVRFSCTSKTEEIKLVNYEKVEIKPITTESAVLASPTPVTSSGMAKHQILLNTRISPIKPQFPIMSFITDDGHEANKLWFKDMLDSHGVKATIAVVTNRIGTEGNLSAADLKVLESENYEIAGHSHTHPHLADITEAEMESELRTCSIILTNLGFNPINFVYPFGSRDYVTDAVVRKYFKYSYRAALEDAILDGTAVNTTPIDPLRIRRVPFDNTSYDEAALGLEICKDAVDLAVAQNAWVVFMVHPHYSEYNFGADYMSRRQDLEDLILYAQSLNVEILNCRDALKYRANMYDIGNKGIDEDYLYIGIDASVEGNLYDKERFI